MIKFMPVKRRTVVKFYIPVRFFLNEIRLSQSLFGYVILDNFIVSRHILFYNKNRKIWKGGEDYVWNF